jgi:hypothetical protein
MRFIITFFLTISTKFIILVRYHSFSTEFLKIIIIILFLLVSPTSSIHPYFPLYFKTIKTI